MSDKTPDDEAPEGQSNPPPPKPDKKPDPPKVPDFDRKQAVHWLAASQFAYTLVGATLLLGFGGHWLGNKLGAPWDVILMLVFGALGFCAEMYRMLKMFSPGNDDKKDKSKKDDSKKNDTGSDES